MTGRLSLGESALVQTLAYRQSSLRAGSRGGAGRSRRLAGSARHGRRRVPGNGAPAVHGAPKAWRLRTPSHFAAGCGARHRFSPSGGAANGMPLNTRTEACPTPVGAGKKTGFNLDLLRDHRGGSRRHRRDGSDCQQEGHSLHHHLPWFEGLNRSILLPDTLVWDSFPGGTRVPSINGQSGPDILGRRDSSQPACRSQRAD